MSDSIMVMSSKLTLNNSLTPGQISKFSNLYFSIGENTVEVPLFEWLDEVRFVEELDHLKFYVMNLKNKIKGEMYVTKKDRDGNISQGKFKISNNISYESCELCIMPRKNKEEKSKPLTEEEKIELFREYWNTKGKLPAKSEVYKGFRIGQFYAMLVKNGATLELLSDILDEGL